MQLLLQGTALLVLPPLLSFDRRYRAAEMDHNPPTLRHKMHKPDRNKLLIQSCSC